MRTQAEIEEAVKALTLCEESSEFITRFSAGVALTPLQWALGITNERVEAFVLCLEDLKAGKSMD